MAKDDMIVLMVKILAKIYTYQRDGVLIEPQEYSFESLGISEWYWKTIMESLIDKEYLKGINIQVTGNGNIYVLPDRPRITPDGVIFLKENSAAKKALYALEKAGTIIRF